MNSRSIRRVSVFCGSSRRSPKPYLAVARSLGTALAERGLTTIYGGGATGLMGALANGVLSAGGRIIGVRPTFISGLEGKRDGLTKLIVTRTMHERKARIYAMSDAYVALPGACGTMDELMEVLTWKRLRLHKRPVCVLNVNGHFDRLLDMFARMVSDGMIGRQYLSSYRVAADVPGVLRALGVGVKEPKPARLRFATAGLVRPAALGS